MHMSGQISPAFYRTSLLLPQLLPTQLQLPLLLVNSWRMELKLFFYDQRLSFKYLFDSNLFREGYLVKNHLFTVDLNILMKGTWRTFPRSFFFSILKYLLKKVLKHLFAVHVNIPQMIKNHLIFLKLSFLISFLLIFFHWIWLFFWINQLLFIKM